jgi:hypothetical protein
MGYRQEVKKTLDYALALFQKHGRVRSAISPKGTPFDFPDYAVDSLPYILYSLAALKDYNLTKKYSQFLKKEIAFHFRHIIDKKTGMVKKNMFFSSMKDHAQRNSSCYDNSMLFLIQKACKKLRLKNPYMPFDYSALITKYFWTGEYFLDDLSGKNYIAGDANIFPFWTGAIKSRKMLKSCISAIKKSKLDCPFPIKYTNTKSSKKTSMFPLSIISGGYEKDTIWTHMGLLYIKLVKKIDNHSCNRYIRQYKATIEKYKNYLEVFSKEGRPFSSLLYYTDDSMIWCANFLSLMRSVANLPDKI